MTPTNPEYLKKGARVYWRGDAADSGTITEKSWDAVTITWDNGHVAGAAIGDISEIPASVTKSAEGMIGRTRCWSGPRRCDWEQRRRQRRQGFAEIDERFAVPSVRKMAIRFFEWRVWLPTGRQNSRRRRAADCWSR